MPKVLLHLKELISLAFTDSNRLSYAGVKVHNYQSFVQLLSRGIKGFGKFSIDGKAICGLVSPWLTHRPVDIAGVFPVPQKR